MWTYGCVGGLLLCYIFTAEKASLRWAFSLPSLKVLVQPKSDTMFFLGLNVHFPLTLDFSFLSFLELHGVATWPKT